MKTFAASVVVVGLLVSPIIPRCDPAVTEELVTRTPECEGLLPPRPKSHLTDSFTIPSTDVCLNGTSESGGGFVVGSYRPSNDAYEWNTRSVTGAALGSFGGVMQSPVLGEPSGYHTLLQGPEDEVFHQSVAAAGTVSRTDSVTPAGRSDYLFHLSNAPSGGSLVLFRSTSNTGNHFFTLTAQRFDTAGAPTTAPSLVDTNGSGDRPAWLVGGVNGLGLSLALWERHGRLIGRWLTDDGTYSTEELGDFLLPSPRDLVVSPMIDNALVLQHDGVWSHRFPSASTAATAPPAWLAALPNTKLVIVRGGLGYAVIPFGGASVPRCEQTVELRSPSGTLCARVTFKQTEAACVTKALDIGRDGTVIQQMASESCDGGNCSCTHHVWPALFR